MPDVESDAPDFDRLARETPWPRREWEKAWNALSRPDAWPTVVDLVAHGFTDGRRRGPTAAADALTRAMTVEPLRRVPSPGSGRA